MIQTADRAVLYARFSSDNQRTESIDAQIRAMKTYCQQHDFQIVETYVDEARSATTDKRPAFQKMIADSASHSFDIVLVHKLDRFARNRYDSAVYKRELKKNGVLVYSVLENLDNSPESIMMEAVLEGMSEYYSQNLAREVAKGMKETALQCKHTGGIPPLGFDVDQNTKKLIINDSEAEYVRIIFDMYSKGYGYGDILKTLHEMNARTKSGNEFQKNSLHSVLTNRKYSGTYVFNRSSSKKYNGTRNNHEDKPEDEMIIIDGGCPEIVDRTTFKAVQKRLAENKRRGACANAKHDYLLSGQLTCGECGRAMTGNARFGGRDKKLQVTYRCHSQKYCCHNKEISRDHLERYVVKLIEENILNAASMRTIKKRISKLQTKGSGMESEKKIVEDRLEKITTELRNIADAIAVGLISTVLTDRLNELEQEKSKLAAKLSEYDKLTDEDTVIVDTSYLLRKYALLKETPSSPEYKTFICGFVDKIIVNRYTVRITLKTGLDVYDSLNTTYDIRRQELYQQYKEKTA